MKISSDVTRNCGIQCRNVYEKLLKIRVNILILTLHIRKQNFVDNFIKEINIISNIYYICTYVYVCIQKII